MQILDAGRDMGIGGRAMPAEQPPSAESKYLAGLGQ